MRPLRQKLHRWVLAKCTCPPAAFLSNKPYSRCSISTRAWAAGWLGAWLAGWLAGWLAAWGTNMRQKRVPLARKCVENANPQHENASKVRTVSPKLHPRDPDERRKCDPFIKKCVENASPRAEIACLDALPQALGNISGRRKSHP